jgi:hypothetical protein
VHPTLRPIKHSLALFAGVVLFLAAFTARASDDDASNLTNAVLEATVTIASNALATISELEPTHELGSNDIAQAEELARGTNALSDTNFPASSSGNAQPGPLESRRQWLLRQRAGAQHGNEPGGPNDTGPTNASAYAGLRPAKPAFSAFKNVTDRNIFDPNRIPHHRVDQPTTKKSFDSFALVGVMSYEKGTFAFFDGTRSEYKRALKVADAIAGYKLASLTPDAVDLVSGTNRVELRVGMQLRREEGGQWTRAEQGEPYSGSSAIAGTSVNAGASVTPAPAGADNEVLERLRKKREQE